MSNSDICSSLAFNFVIISLSSPKLNDALTKHDLFKFAIRLPLDRSIKSLYTTESLTGNYDGLQLWSHPYSMAEKLVTDP